MPITEDWDAVMDPVRALTPDQWSIVRTAVSRLIEAEMVAHCGPEHGMGVSSSDINHRVFEIVARIPKQDRRWDTIIRAVRDEINWAMP